ncbi:signaling mucin HKR1 [Drosophila elegans]|uniref:signaling mucin HKR1 n=1 Tax=Drosophila elegans TaxID=30023 RepID=UPI0007E68863|nr:signaling mucin HKR1 [Drosophila elegans]XP_017127689.1 signaling mucin HKR1 [Drosophila elegans]
MMQRCSELGKNSMAWQHLVRFGRSNLKVKKGPSGHYLEKRCRDELEKSLPAESFKDLMVFVAKWLKRLDDKNGIKHQKEAAQPDTAAKAAVEKPGGIQAPTNLAVVDLCSDGEDEKPNVCMLDNEPLDSDSVISSSSIVILDDELGEVNLKDYADHVDGKLDAASLKKRNSVDEERGTTSKARKQTTIKEFLTPKKTLSDTSPPSALRRSLKTYVRKSKVLPTVASGTGKQSSLILRELNLEGVTNSNGSAREETQSDLIIIDDLSEENFVNEEDKNTTLLGEKNKPKTTHNDAKTKSEELKSIDLMNKETPTCNPISYNEIKPKLTVNNPQTAPIKIDTEVPLKTNGEAKENSEPSKAISSEVPAFEKNETSPPKNEDPKLNSTINDSLKKEVVKAIPLSKEMLLADAQTDREKKPLTSAPTDFIRVRTDLIAPPETPNQLQDQVDRMSQTQTSNPSEAADKRRLTPESTGYHLQPKRPTLDNYNPESVNTSRYPPNIPVNASSYQPIVPVGPGAINTSRYSPVIPAIASTVSNTRYQPASASGNTSSYLSNATVATASISTSSIRSVFDAPAPLSIPSYYTNAGYPPVAPVVALPGSATIIMPMAPGSANTFGYPPPRYAPGIPVAPAAISTTYHQGINPLTPARALTSSYQPVISATPVSKHHPPLPVAPAPVVTSNNQQINPVSPAPTISSSIQPNIPVASAPLSKSSHQLTGSDPRSDLANIMGMLAQVELFAYGQKNQEAFHLVNQLRISLQMGAAQSCQAPQRKA